MAIDQNTWYAGSESLLTVTALVVAEFHLESIMLKHGTPVDS